MFIHFPRSYSVLSDEADFEHLICKRTPLSAVAVFAVELIGDTRERQLFE